MGQLQATAPQCKSEGDQLQFVSDVIFPLKAQQ
jgi:hypothetical protein